MKPYEGGDSAYYLNFTAPEGHWYTYNYVTLNAIWSNAYIEDSDVSSIITDKRGFFLEMEILS